MGALTPRASLNRAWVAARAHVQHHISTVHVCHQIAVSRREGRDSWTFCEWTVPMDVVSCLVISACAPLVCLQARWCTALMLCRGNVQDNDIANTLHNAAGSSFFADAATTTLFKENEREHVANVTAASPAHAKDDCQSGEEGLALSKYGKDRILTGSECTLASSGGPLVLRDPEHVDLSEKGAEPIPGDPGGPGSAVGGRDDSVPGEFGPSHEDVGESVSGGPGSVDHNEGATVPLNHDPLGEVGSEPIPGDLGSPGKQKHGVPGGTSPQESERGDVQVGLRILHAAGPDGTHASQGTAAVHEEAGPDNDFGAFEEAQEDVLGNEVRAMPAETDENETVDGTNFEQAHCRKETDDRPGACCEGSVVASEGLLQGGLGHQKPGEPVPMGSQGTDHETSHGIEYENDREGGSPGTARPAAAEVGSDEDDEFGGFEEGAQSGDPPPAFASPGGAAGAPETVPTGDHQGPQQPVAAGVGAHGLDLLAVDTASLAEAVSLVLSPLAQGEGFKSGGSLSQLDRLRDLWGSGKPQDGVLSADALDQPQVMLGSLPLPL